MRKKRILIVDHQEDNLSLLGSLLRGHDYEVDEACHGAVALELARLAPPDLVIADIVMPVMHGFVLCRAWKQDEHLQSIPFFFYTSTYTDDQDRAFALSLGADQFIVKIEDPKVLMAMIRETLHPVQAAAASDLLATEATMPDGDYGYLKKRHNEMWLRGLGAQMPRLDYDHKLR
jgi:CheY-like chemotaxis protein